MMAHYLIFCVLMLLPHLAHPGFAEEKPSCKVTRVVLSGKRSSTTSPIPTEERIQMLDISVPNPEGLRTQLSPYLDLEIDETKLEEIKTTISAHYQKHHRPLIVITIPPQDITCGTLQILILEATIGEVTYKGNRWYPKSLIEKRMRLKKGDLFEEDKVLNNLSWLNAMPFHQTQMAMSEGKQPLTTDVEFITQDRFLLRPYNIEDNTGQNSTGTFHWAFGADLLIPSLCDTVLTYQYTAGVQPHQFQSHYGKAQIWFPGKQGLSFYGGYSIVNPNVPSLSQTGVSWQISARHQIPLLPLYTSCKHKLSWGADFKNTNNNILFLSDTEALITTSFVNIFQFALEYTFEYAIGNHQLYLVCENYFSPGRWLPDQTPQDYFGLRPGATPLYYYMHVTFSDLYVFGKNWQLLSQFQGQISTTPLLPSEQFGLGGLYTVRGYEERAYSGDNILFGSTELRSPFFFLKQENQGFAMVAFLDTGFGWNEHTSSGENKSAFLIGIGPGVRFQYQPYVSVRMDYGFKLHNVPYNPDNLGRFHFSANFMY